MKNHPPIETLSAYVDAELDEKLRTEVGRHLAECAECAAQTRALQSATAAISALPRVEVSADEHRALRQSILRARPAGAAGRWAFPQRWALAGGVAIVAIAIVGVVTLRPWGPRVSEQASTPATGAGVFDFTSARQVRDTVLSLPEVSGASRPPEMARSARDEESDAPDAAPPAPPESLASKEAARDANALASPEGGGAGGAGVGGSAGGSGQYAGSTSGGDDGGGSDGTGGQESGADLGSSQQAADQCLVKVAEAENQRLVPLLAREASFKGQPAWLLVYARSASSDPTAPLDRIQVYLVPPTDCATLSGAPLIERALYQSAFDRP